MAEIILFDVFSFLAIAAALMVVVSADPVHSVLYLVVTMFSISALFALLGAHFLAVIQILIYAGAVLVLFLFVVMMLDLAKEAPSMRQTLGLRVLGSVTAVAFVGEIFFLLRSTASSLAMAPGHPHQETGSIEAIGRALFSKHLLAFELTSFLMLAAILGAVVLSKKHWS